MKPRAFAVIFFLAASTSAWAESVSEGMSLSVALGAGHIGGDSASQGMAWRIGLGYAVAPWLHLTLDTDNISFARYQPDPTLSRQLGTLTVGARIRPFGAPTGEETGWTDHIQLHAAVGVAHQVLMPYDDLSPLSTKQGSWGPAVTGSIAWLLLHGDGWNAGTEFQQSYARLDGVNSLSMSVLLVFRLESRTSARPRSNPVIARAD
jgi:hypothetical protein